MFQGASRLNLDVKARFIMPVRHRDVIKSTLTLTKHPDGCLMLFPADTWHIFKQKVNALPMSAQWWKRVFLGNAVEVEMDKSGRILITPELKSSAGLQKEIVIMGLGGYFEIWDATTYDNKEAQAILQPMPDVLNDFSF